MGVVATMFSVTVYVIFEELKKKYNKAAKELEELS